MLHKLTEFIPNIMFNTVNQFLFEYCLCIKRKFNLTVDNKKLQQTDKQNRKCRKIVIP